MKHASFLLMAILGMAGCQEDAMPELGAKSSSDLSDSVAQNQLSANPYVGIPGSLVQARPEAAKNVSGGKIEIDGQRAEVIGICRYDETDVGCWAPNGAALPSLAKDVIAKLEEMAAAPHRHGQIPWNIGKRNWIAVTETSAHGQKPGPFAVQNVEGGRDMSGFSLDRNRMSLKGPYINRSAKFFWTEPGVKTFSIMTARALSPAKAIKLDFKAGASGSAGSASAKILSLDIASPAPNTSPNSSTVREITMDLEITGIEANWNVSLFPLMKLPANSFEISKSPIMPMFSLVKRAGNVFTVRGALNPADVTALSISFHQTHRYRLTGLPLKP